MSLLSRQERLNALYREAKPTPIIKKNRYSYVLNYEKLHSHKRRFNAHQVKKRKIINNGPTHIDFLKSDI